MLVLLWAEGGAQQGQDSAEERAVACGVGVLQEVCQGVQAKVQVRKEVRTCSTQRRQHHNGIHDVKNMQGWTPQVPCQ